MNLTDDQKHEIFTIVCEKMFDFLEVISPTRHIGILSRTEREESKMYLKCSIDITNSIIKFINKGGEK